MRKASKLQRKLLKGIAALTLAVGIFAMGVSMSTLTSYAEGQVKITTLGDSCQISFVSKGFQEDYTIMAR